MFKKINFWLILLLLIIIPSFFSLVRSGFFPMQDGMQVFRLYEMDKCVKDLQIPCRWIPDGGYQYGYPQFNFYAPLVYYFGEIIHLIGFQFIDSIKILFVLGFILSAASMYFLVKEFFGNFPALVAAILYTYAPYHAQQVYVRGSLSEFFASVFFPLILLFSYKLITSHKSPITRWFILLSVSLAGLFLTHNILSFLFLPIFIFWVVFWLWKLNDQVSSIKYLVSSVLLGFGLSAFFLLPMLFERQYVHVETLLGGYFDYRQHFVNLKQLFLSNNWGYGSSALGPVDDLALSTGIVHWIAGILAIIIAAFRFKKEKKTSLLIFGLGAIELVILFLMHEKSSFIWSGLGFLSWLQFPWRFLSLSVFILSFLSAYLISGLGKLKYIVGIGLAVAVLVLHSGFFTPKSWLNIRDIDELSGNKWEANLTASIFDYLPASAVLPPDKKAPDYPEILEGGVIFVNYKKGSDWQGGVIKVSEDSVVRFPVYDFPGMTVYIDGKKAEHVNSDCRNQKHCLGLITTKVPQGAISIKVQLNDTPVRIVGNMFTLAGIAGLIYFLINKNEKLNKK